MLGFSPLGTRPLGSLYPYIPIINTPIVCAHVSVVARYLAIVSVAPICGTDMNNDESIPTFNFGDDIRFKISIVDEEDNNAPVNPTTLTLYLKLPDGTVQNLTSSIVQEGVGNFHADYTIPSGGAYYYRWVSTGNAQVSEEGTFQALFSNIL